MLGPVREEAKESKPQPMLMNDFLPPLASRGSPILSVIEVSTISHFLPTLHPTSSPHCIPLPHWEPGICLWLLVESLHTKGRSLWCPHKTGCVCTRPCTTSLFDITGNHNHCRHGCGVSERVCMWWVWVCGLCVWFVCECVCVCRWEERGVGRECSFRRQSYH